MKTPTNKLRVDADPIYKRISQLLEEARHADFIPLEQRMDVDANEKISFLKHHFDQYLERNPHVKRRIVRSIIADAKKLVKKHGLPDSDGVLEQVLKATADRVALILRGSSRAPKLVLCSVIVPARKVTEGLLVRSTSVAWGAIVEKLGKDWSAAYEITPPMWEEIIAGAFSKAGFDNVVLTPRSGDFGRDVIAVSKGVGCIKIIGSVKAYKPGHLVKHEDVRALLGVLSGEQNASKAILATTSDFAPRIAADPFIKSFIPTRLELVNGLKLREWLLELAVGKQKRPKKPRG